MIHLHLHHKPLQVLHVAPQTAEYQKAFLISFRCDPERAEELTNAVFVSIKEVQQNGIDPDYVTRVQEQQRQARTVSLEENGFWLSTLRSAYYSDSMVQPEDILSYNELVDSLTASDLQEATNMWLTDRYVRVTLFPEESSE